jgi:hypothetical protein
MEESTVGEEATHELVLAFAEHGLALNAKLVEMLNEHYTHRTERRGCGYAQASRHLATLVNLTPEQRRDAQSMLFCRQTQGQAAPEDVSSRVLGLLAREESRLLCAIIADLVWSPLAPSAEPSLPLPPDKLEIGTCSLAEKFFLEIANNHQRRGGRINILVTQEDQPVLVEKEGLGDSHSCISVSELQLNGVRLPPGSLFGVQYEAGATLRPNRQWPGNVIAIERCTGFRFLRLTTLAVSPNNRLRAFSTQFEAQVNAGFFSPGSATIAQVKQIASEQI